MKTHSAVNGCLPVFAHHPNVLTSSCALHYNNQNDQDV